MGGATRGGARRGCRSGGGVASTATTSRRATAGDPGRPCVRKRLGLERRYPTSGRLHPTSLSAAGAAPPPPHPRRQPPPRRRGRGARGRGRADGGGSRVRGARRARCRGAAGRAWPPAGSIRGRLADGRWRPPRCRRGGPRAGAPRPAVRVERPWGAAASPSAPRGREHPLHDAVLDARLLVCGAALRLAAWGAPPLNGGDDPSWTKQKGTALKCRL